MFMNQIIKKTPHAESSIRWTYICVWIYIIIYIYNKKENTVFYSVRPLLSMVFIFLKNRCRNTDQYGIASYDRWCGPLLVVGVPPHLAKGTLDGLYCKTCYSAGTWWTLGSPAACERLQLPSKWMWFQKSNTRNISVLYRRCIIQDALPSVSYNSDFFF